MPIQILQHFTSTRGLCPRRANGGRVAASPEKDLPDTNSEKHPSTSRRHCPHHVIVPYLIPDETTFWILAKPKGATLSLVG